MFLVFNFACGSKLPLAIQGQLRDITPFTIILAGLLADAADEGTMWLRYFDRVGWDIVELVEETDIFLGTIHSLFCKNNYKVAKDSFYSRAVSVVKTHQIYHFGANKESHMIYAPDITEIVTKAP
jgi:hypothetical protein